MNDQTTTVADLKRMIAQFVAERDWQQFHDPKNLTMSIAIEAAELMEHFQWLRSDQLKQVLADADQKQLVAEELADVVAYVISLANVLDVDVSLALEKKMKKNAEKYPSDRYRGKSG